MLLSIVPTAESILAPVPNGNETTLAKSCFMRGIIRTMRGEATDQLRDCQIRRNSQSVSAITRGWNAFFSRVALDAAFR